MIEHILQSPYLVDFLFLVFGVAAARAPQLAIFIRVSLFIVKIAQWYFKTHPSGKKIARLTDADEELTTIKNDAQQYENNHLHGTVFSRGFLERVAFIALLTAEVLIASAIATVAIASIRDIWQIHSY